MVVRWQDHCWELKGILRNDGGSRFSQKEIAEEGTRQDKATAGDQAAPPSQAPWGGEALWSRRRQAVQHGTTRKGIIQRLKAVAKQYHQSACSRYLIGDQARRRQKAHVALFWRRFRQRGCFWRPWRKRNYKFAPTNHSLPQRIQRQIL